MLIFVCHVRLGVHSGGHTGRLWTSPEELPHVSTQTMATDEESDQEQSDAARRGTAAFTHNATQHLSDLDVLVALLKMPLSDWLMNC